MRLVASRAAIAGVLLLQLCAAVLCLWWTVANIGMVPHYGDTPEYMGLSKRGVVDEYRGMLYPAILRLANDLRSERDTPFEFRFETGLEARKGRCAAPPILAKVQLGQIALAAFAAAYAVWIFARKRDHSGAPLVGILGSILIWALLLFDPLLGHFNLSILTDGPATWLVVIFCCALADLATRRSPLPVAALLIVISQVAAASLRAEKNLVLLAAGSICVLVWLFIARRLGEQTDWLRKRAIVAAACLATGFISASSLHDLYEGNLGRWPLRTTIAHHRIVFPHLTAVYDELPHNVQEVISRQDARFYDKQIHNTWAVINKVTGRNPMLREELTAELVQVVLRERLGWILLDVVTDSIENVFSTVSWYVRLGDWFKTQNRKRNGYFVAVPWTYIRMDEHTRVLTPNAVAIAASALVSSALLAFALLPARDQRLRISTFWQSSKVIGAAPLIPVVATVVVNAVAFALSSDLLHIRYGPIAHPFWLLLVYGTTLHLIRRESTASGRTAAITTRSPR